MKKYITTITQGIKLILSQKKYFIIFLITSLVFFGLFIIIPVYITEGNSIVIQLNSLDIIDYITIIFLSLVYGVFLALQVYTMKLKREAKRAGKVIGGGAGALFAGIVGTAFCPSCIAPLFALFGIGFGGTLFVLENRFYFIAGILILMFISIYFLARKIVGVCTSC